MRPAGWRGTELTAEDGTMTGRTPPPAFRHRRAGEGRRVLTAVSVAAIMLTLLAQGAPAQSCMEWVRRSTEGPSPRWGIAQAMVYDSARERCVLFGGRGLDSLLADTWAWSGTSWTLAAETGPQRRYAHAMAFDSWRNRVVLVGGASTGYIRDTWEWDGERWSLVTTDGLLPIGNHAMAFDSTRGVTVLFGGYGSGVYRATREWDGVSWTHVTSEGPGPRLDHAMAFDARRGVTVLFGGGGANSEVYGDTWEWDGISWTQVATDGPAPRQVPSMTYDSARGVIVLFGGVNRNQHFDDTWEWDGLAWRQIASSGPSARATAASAFDFARGSVVLFGGSIDVGREVLGDTWEYRRQPRLSIDFPNCSVGGLVTIEWSCTTPHGIIALLFARTTGETTIPDGRPCAGTRLGLGPQNLQLVHTARSDSRGSGSVRAIVSHAARGGRAQVLDVTTCALSAVVPVE